MNNTNILAELVLIHQHIINNIIAPDIDGFVNEDKFSSGYYGEDDGYCVDGYAKLGDEDVTFSISLTETEFKTSLFYQDTGKTIKCSALNKQLESVRAAMAKKGLFAACRRINRVGSAFNDVNCNLLLNKAKYKEMPQFEAEDRDPMYIEHYIDVGKTDYVVLLTLTYIEKERLFEFSYCSDDEDNGNTCGIILDEFDHKVAEVAIRELSNTYRAALSEHGIDARFRTLRPALHQIMTSNDVITLDCTA